MKELLRLTITEHVEQLPKYGTIDLIDSLIHLYFRPFILIGINGQCIRIRQSVLCGRSFGCNISIS